AEYSGCARHQGLRTCADYRDNTGRFVRRRRHASRIKALFRYPVAAMSLFTKSDPVVEKTYAAIFKAVSKFGNVRAEEKKTSIHVCAKTGFAGVHPRKTALLLVIRSASPIKSSRIRKIEKVSTNRFHNEMLLDSPKD